MSDSLWAQQEHGYWPWVLVAAVFSIASWNLSSLKEAQVAPAAAQAHPVSELKTLPGSPENEASSVLKGVGYEEARKLNAAIPFAPSVGMPPEPFRFVGSDADHARATDCLALAAMAEAGEGDQGQRAVIQVVLNRVRHPAFAKTVCGVVFEGSHRATGCQFTFTCDGALARRYSASAWARARERAAAALDGQVFAPVGVATHYHTDWVHPYWSASLTKLARIDTHLFFRWPGYWGNARSVSVAYRGGEPSVAQISYLSAHAEGAAVPAAKAFAGSAIGAPGSDVVVRNGDGGAFVLLTGAPSAVAVREIGRSICMDRPTCKVLGWFDPASIPGGYPVPASARAQLGFSYYRDARNDEIVLYDCARFADVTAEGCIPRANGVRSAQRATADAAPVAETARRIVAAKVGRPMTSGEEITRGPCLASALEEGCAPGTLEVLGRNSAQRAG